MTSPFRTAILVVTLAGFAATANGQDFAKGMAFAKAGNHVAALKEWLPLAKQGHIEAQFNLGEIYRKGNGVEIDLAESLRWYRLAAEQGNVNAQITAGFIYYDGKSGLQDAKEAMHWARLAAQQGHVVAQSLLGVIHAQGKGVPKNAVAAHVWYSTAFENGYQNAGRLRDNLETTMTPEQITQAAEKAKTCLSSNYTNCD